MLADALVGAETARTGPGLAMHPLQAKAQSGLDWQGQPHPPDHLIVLDLVHYSAHKETRCMKCGWTRSPVRELEEVSRSRGDDGNLDDGA
jgi:hypothetical protein